MSENPNISTLSEQAELALYRSQVYAFLSRAFLYPREPLLDCLTSAQGALQALGQEALASELEPLKAAGHSLEDRRSDYLRVYGHTLNPDFPPYETEFGCTSLYQQTEALGDVAAFYKSCGLESTSEERADHIGVELEFMYFLTFKEAYAWQHHGAEKAEVCVAMQKRFLETHLGCWCPLFLRLVQRKSANAFYQVMAGVGREFVTTDVELVGAHPKLLAETDFNPKALSARNATTWQVEGCGDDCV